MGVTDQPCTAKNIPGFICTKWVMVEGCPLCLYWQFEGIGGTQEGGTGGDEPIEDQLPPIDWVPNPQIPKPQSDFDYRLWANKEVSFYNKTLGNVSSYKWDFGDGRYSALKNPKHTYSSPGIYTIGLTAKNSSGSTVHQEEIEVIDLIPEVDFIYTSGGLACYFQDASTIPINATRWTFGDGDSGYGLNIIHLFDVPGTYTVTFYTDQGSVSKDITVSEQASEYVPLLWMDFRNTVALPNANDLRKNTGVNYVFDADAVSAQQINQAVNGAGIKFKLWTAPASVACGLSHDNPDANWETIDYCFMYWYGATPGLWIYENGIARLEVGSGSYDDILSIIINSEGKIEYRKNDVLLYTSLISPSFPLFADASIDIINMYNGIREAEIKIGGGAGITVLPIAHFTANPTNGNAPLTVNFTDESTGSPDEWLWEFGDGETSTDQNPIHIFDEEGIYTVRLTITNDLGSDFVEGYIIVREYIPITPPSPDHIDDWFNWYKGPDRYYYIDTENNKIGMYDFNYDYIGEFGSYGTGNGQFNTPTTLAIAENSIYVVDSLNNRIQVFNLEGEYQSQWGTEGTGNGQFDNPFGIATNGLDGVGGVYLYITDTGNNRIQVFDLDGTYLYQFGSYNGGDGQFNNPHGIAVDYNFIYVVDTGNNRLQIFNLSGDFLQKVGEFGSGVNQFNNPTKCKMDDVFWYIKDEGNDRIIIYPKNINYGYEPVGMLDKTLTIVNDINAEGF